MCRSPLVEVMIPDLVPGLGMEGMLVDVGGRRVLRYQDGKQQLQRVLESMVYVADAYDKLCMSQRELSTE